MLNSIGQGLPGLRLKAEQSAHLVTLTQVSQGFLDSINDVLNISARFDVKSSGMKDRP